MQKKLLKAFDKFFHDMSLVELREQNDNSTDSNVSYHDSLYLDLIYAHPNEYTSTQLADMLQVSRPAVTQKINDLVEKGHIVRTQSETDKRYFYLSVNDKKKEEIDAYRKGDEEMTVKIMEKFGTSDLEKFCEILDFISTEYVKKSTKGNLHAK